ncbi:MAG TPA: bacillithiol biosynthesis BshC, partial [Catalimonadaceae bacterium]|nr:bacillithiol biosynthesis BshC [Catalimonadaceae bacterium]
ASATLNQLGFKEQIHARPVNLFYLREGERLRLEAIGDTIRTTEGEYQWTRDEAIAYFKENPLCLSPNVAFRPLYSQLILPDVAFIGGPAELAYWLQLGQVFEQAKVPFPILLPRFSGLYVNQKQVQKMKNLNIKPSDFFKDWTQMKRDLFVPEGLIPDFEKVFSPMMDWAKSVDVTLVPAAHAELTRMRKQAEHLQNRIRKAAERRNEIQISQIKNLFEELFPNGNLQERTESWLSFVVENPDWLDAIFNLIDPLDMQFQVILEDKPGSAERAS